MSALAAKSNEVGPGSETKKPLERALIVSPETHERSNFLCLG